MLKGLRPFILTIDKTQTLGKICKCYDSIARNTLLSTKIENPKLHLISSSELQRDVLIESFRRGYDYEIASVQHGGGSSQPHQHKQTESYNILFHTNKNSCM